VRSWCSLYSSHSAIFAAEAENNAPPEFPVTATSTAAAAAAESFESIGEFVDVTQECTEVPSEGISGSAGHTDAAAATAASSSPSPPSVQSTLESSPVSEQVGDSRAAAVAEVAEASPAAGPLSSSQKSECITTAAASFELPLRPRVSVDNAATATGSDLVNVAGNITATPVKTPRDYSLLSARPQSLPALHVSTSTYTSPLPSPIFAAAAATAHDVVDALAVARAYNAETRSLLAQKMLHQQQLVDGSRRSFGESSSLAAAAASPQEKSPPALVPLDVARMVDAEVRGPPPPLPSWPPPPFLMDILGGRDSIGSTT
jgi:hypothetical protein